MRKIILLGVLFFSSLAVARPDHPIEHQLVTVRVTYQEWNEYRPWQKSKPNVRSFLGTVISKNRILVQADCLEDATLIQLEKFDRPPRIPARIVHCDDQVGLAILTTDEPEFFSDLNPVDIAEAAEGDKFYCAAWKSGQLTFSACRWAQVKCLNSSVPYFSYAGIYFITDLKGGGWGEPVFCNERMVGITQSQDNDRATVIPSDLILTYLRAVDMPKYPGFGRLGIDYQFNTGKAQAAYFGQSGMPMGIRIQSCFPGGSADGVLRPDDILLELDGHAINSQGDYEHPRYGLMGVNLIATENHYAGDILLAKVLRNKEVMEVNVPLKNIPAQAALIPHARPNEPPPYLIAGGFVFRELDIPYLRAWGNKWFEQIPGALRILDEMQSESQTPEQKRLIVLADVFPDEYNLGYHEMAQNIVKSVNGQAVDSIRDMEEAFQHPQNGFHIIEFMPAYGVAKVILDAGKFTEATAAILKKYQIPARIRM